MILLPEEYWEIRTTEKKGRGVFAKKDIEPGTVIGDYIGKVIKTAEEDLYEKDEYLYLMYYHDQASLYPDRKKPGLHIINHSCAPNCWMHTYKGHTLYFSLRRIFKGEELTVSYLLSPIDKYCNPCTHVCHCGAMICSGTMHLSEKKYKEWQEFDNKKAEKTVRERIKFGEDLPLLSSYPKSILDHPIYTLFGSVEKPPEIYTDKKLPEISELRQRIRETGKILQFPALNIRVLGIQDDTVFSESM